MPLKKLTSRIKSALLGRDDKGGERKSGEAKKKAAAQGDFAAQEEALKPKDGAAPATRTGLPESTQELLASAAFKVSGGNVYVGAEAIPPQIASLLMHGIVAEGISDAKTLAQALADYVDEGRVEVLDVKGAGAGLTWIRFTAGDTEVGYLFDGKSLNAIVSDGWINRV